MNTLLKTLAFPYSAILAGTFLVIVLALHCFAKDSKLVRTMRSALTGRVLLAVGAVILAIEGTWSIPLHHSFLFVGYALILMLSLLLTLLDGLRGKVRPGMLLNHLGVLLIVWAALFGAPDISRSQVIVGRGESTNFSVANDGFVINLPFTIALEDFHIDYYEDGKSPKQYTSHLLVGGEHIDVSVNNPGSYQGYTIYQQSYDRTAQQFTILQMVRDPWLPFIYLGMCLLAVGSVLLLFGKWRARLVIPVTLVLTALFTALSVAKINFGTLMPALRSWWFVPHLFIYMVAYSLMALALIMWLVELRKKNGHWRMLSDNLMRSSSALLIIGMLTGSVWARQAWGDYWAWDPKENWAAVTWFISLMHLHLNDKRGWKAITILVLAFLALQITWYGVNYLPSAMDSLHTYNS